MNTRKPLLLSLVIGALAVGSAAQAPRAQATGQTPTANPATASVSISANCTDVRTVLRDLFTQTKQNYVIEPGIRYALYLSLDKVDFDEALAIVCHLAHIKAEKQNGIYYVTEDKPAATPKATPGRAKPLPTDGDAPGLPAITPTTLKVKRVTTRLAKTDIRKVFATISKEAGVPIIVDASVPPCRMDAFLEKTSLKYALDHIASAAKLHYRIVNKQEILVFADEAENRVSVTSS